VFGASETAGGSHNTEPYCWNAISSQAIVSLLEHCQIEPLRRWWQAELRSDTVEARRRHEEIRSQLQAQSLQQSCQIPIDDDSEPDVFAAWDVEQEPEVTVCQCHCSHSGANTRLIAQRMTGARSDSR
jgi:hypothetical protein